jgi:hypothetical protein
MGKRMLDKYDEKKDDEGLVLDGAGGIDEEEVARKEEIRKRLAASLGRAVQVDPIKPKLKPLATKRLKVKCDILLSTTAFKFNLRRYTWAPRT